MSLFDGMAEIFRDTFGEAVTYGHGTVSMSLQGIVQLPTVARDGMSDEGAGSLMQLPEVSFPLADLPAGYCAGDTVQMRGLPYRVKAILPDGRGMVLMHLERA